MELGPGLAEPYSLRCPMCNAKFTGPSMHETSVPLLSHIIESQDINHDLKTLVAMMVVVKTIEIKEASERMRELEHARNQSHTLH